MSQSAYKSIFASDIFNLEQKSPETERLHKVKHNQNKSSVFNDICSQQEKALRSQRSVGTKSDIFFKNKVEVKEPNRENRNLPHRSIVFSHLNSKDYVVIKPRDGKIYDPSSYYREETPVIRRMKELYSDGELNFSDGSITKRAATSMGYIEKENESQQPIQNAREKMIKRKFLWRMGQNTEHNDSGMLSSSQIIKMSHLKSNIFNDSQKDKENNLNNTVGKGITYQEKEPLFMSPKNVTRSKWSHKLDWKSPQNELLFKTPNEKEEEKRTAFQRKYNQFYGSVPDLRQLPIEQEVLKENIDSYLPPEYHKVDKARRAYDNVSIGFDENFYKNNLKYATNNTNDHEYQIPESKGIDITDLKKIFDTKGIHVYNIVDDTSFMPGNTSIRFKIRENNNPNYNIVFNEIRERIKKENGIEIAPIQKIRVNKLKPKEFLCSEDTEKNNNTSTNNPDNALKRNKTGKVREFRKRFSQDFAPVNKTYKNYCLRKYQSHVTKNKQK